ncbi:hypothetical protein ABTY96_36755 [Streptomyces sp. NPDC096057]|uniref:hypothetical protein n=1 Tax=Streptomyces sp. NPDC096057 TaxID=3155543 RepID=UPI00333331CF
MRQFGGGEAAAEAVHVAVAVAIAVAVAVAVADKQGVLASPLDEAHHVTLWTAAPAVAG